MFKMATLMRLRLRQSEFLMLPLALRRTKRSNAGNGNTCLTDTPIVNGVYGSKLAFFEKQITILHSERTTTTLFVLNGI